MTAVFAPRHNWATPYVERWSYRTNVLPSEDGTEQRVWLKLIPDRQDVLAPTTGRAVDSAAMDALLVGGQTETWAVPYWPGITTLDAQESSGSNVVLGCVTTDRGFANGAYAVLYADDRTTELVGPLTALSGSGFTVPTLAATWPAGTLVLPARLARLGTDPAFARPSTRVAQTEVTFDYLPGADPGVAQVTTAQMFDVARFTRRRAPHDALQRTVERAQSPTFTFAEFQRLDTPVGQRTTAPLWIPDRATWTALLAWFHGLRGACTTFYVPSYTQDFTVRSGLGTTTLVVEWTGYTDRLFPRPARRTLALLGPTGTITQARVLTATDNGATETLTLDVTAPADTILACFALYVRLASDDLGFRWLTSVTAEATLELLECPGELQPTSVLVDGDGNIIEEPPSPPNPAAGPAVASMSTARVPAGREDVATIGTIYLRDANGLLASSAPSTVTVAVTGANTATPTLTTLATNTRQFRYVPGNQGSDSVAITYGGVAISGSPYTSVVGPTASTTGIGSGFWWADSARYGTYPDTATVQGTGPAFLLAQLAAAQAAGVAVWMQFFRNSVKDAAGHFSLTKFQALVDAVAALSGINAYIADGTFRGHCIADEPYWAPSWGGQVVPAATLNAALAYSKAALPGVLTAIRAEAWRLPGISATHLDYCWGQIDAPTIDVTAYRTRAESAARTLGVRMIYGLNVLNGGDGSSGVRGTGEFSGTRWCMGASEILTKGRILAAAPLGDYLLHGQYLARYATTYFDRADIAAAFTDLAAFCAGQVR